MRQILLNTWTWYRTLPRSCFHELEHEMIPPIVPFSKPTNISSGTFPQKVPKRRCLGQGATLSRFPHQFKALSLKAKHLVMPSNHASTHSLAWPSTNFGSLIFYSSLVMSLSGGPPPESLDASGLPIPDGGGSTSIPAGWRLFKVSFMASKERRMRANSSDGCGGVGGLYVDAPLPWFPLILTILYTWICINQNFVREEFKETRIHITYTWKHRVRRNFIFYLSVNKH
jgi:hypothetical protein